MKRIIKLTADKTISYSEMGDLLLEDKNVYSSDNLRKAFYVLEKIVDNIEDDYVVTDNDLIKIIDQKKLELEKQTMKYSDQKREYRNYMRADSRFENLLSVMKDTIVHEGNYEYLNSYIDDGIERTACASAILSDWHGGLEFYDELNTFNFEVLTERVNELKARIISHCKLHNVAQLNIELLGDLVNGYLHISSRCFNEEDVITQTMKVSKLLCEMINDMAQYIPQINVYSCIGNHGRCSANLKESIQVENFERLITWHLQSAIKCENVFIQDCKSDFIEYRNMNGDFVIAAHGNLDKPNTVVDKYIRLYKRIPDYVHLGHTHYYQEDDRSDINVVVNGSLSGTDQYAKSIRESSIPCQVLIVYGGKDGDDCIYKMKFK